MKREALTTQQSEAIVHLLDAPSVAEAARQAGVARATLYNWLKKPHFRAELDQARRAEHQVRLNRLRVMTTAALDALEGLLASDDERIQLRAASEVLRAYQRLVSQEQVGMPVLEAGDEEWTEETVPLLAQKCMEGLLNGTLDSRAAHMAPQYLAMLERSLEKEAFRRRREELDRMGPVERAERIVEALRRIPFTGIPEERIPEEPPDDPTP